MDTIHFNKADEGVSLINEDGKVERVRRIYSYKNLTFNAHKPDVLRSGN